MASRRLRLKAVINLPVRRGRENEPAAVTAANSPKIPLSSNTEFKDTSIDPTKTETLDKSDICNTSSSAVSVTDSVNSVLDKETSEKDVDQNRVLKNGVLTKSPTQIAKTLRKRLNPTVNFSVTRKSRDSLSDKSEPGENVLKPSSKNVSKPTSVILSGLGITKLPVKTTEAVQTIEEDPSCTATVSSNGDSPSFGKIIARIDPVSGETNTNVDVGNSAKNIKTKSVKPKPSPRLVDATVRRNASSTESGDADKQPVLSLSRPIGNKPESESDDVVCPNISRPSKTNVVIAEVSIPSTAPSIQAGLVHATAFSEDTQETDVAPNSKTEKRTTHRRLRKNGVVELLTKARRDFQTKYGNKAPDKKQLTMFDLIFYNPATNPMKITEIVEDNKNVLPNPCKANLDRLAEEKVDDLNAVESDDEENAAMPAPQVKVGPDGSLIIDEKSLVIETTGSQKRKDELANSAVVMEYGLGNTTYNSFSNKVKSKEWSKEETLKFYRALHSVGTDFLLMQSIFPKRTRKDLKMKFKKEDRMNRDLVDKALRHPLEFNLSQMEKDLEQEEKENEVKRQNEIMLKETASERKKKLKERKVQKGLNSFLGKSLEAEDSGKDRATRNKARQQDDVFVEPAADQQVDSEAIKDIIRGKRKRKATAAKKSPSNDVETRKKPKKRVSKKSKIDHGDSMSSSDDESVVYSDDHAVSEERTDTVSVEEVVLPIKPAAESVSGPQKFTVATVGHVDMSSSDDEEVFLKTTQQTRYGRIPQRRILSSEESESEDEYKEIGDQIANVKNETHPDSGANTSVPLDLPGGTQFCVPDLSNVEPGSLVILSTPGQSSFQLFMVGPKGDGGSEGQLSHIPVAITQEMMAAVSHGIAVREPRPSDVTDKPCTDTKSQEHETIVGM